MTQEECKSIYESVKVMKDTIGSVVLQTFLDIDAGIQYLHAISKEGYVVKFYQGDKFCGILAFDVGRDWWSGDTTILFEVTVLSCLGCHGVQREAMKTLNKLAHEYDAKMIITGCFFQKDSKVVANGYKKFGFDHTYPTFAKVVEHDY